MFLLDTNVLSELRKPKPHGAVLAWFNVTPRIQLAVPAIVIAELQKGADLTRRHNPGKAAELEYWIDYVMMSLKILPMNGILFREWARLMAGKSDDIIEDAMIAATARIHKLTVVTRNTKDFADFAVDLLNPFTFVSDDRT